MHVIIGIVMVAVGGLLAAPFTRTFFRRYNEFLFRAMPWMQRVPGVRFYYQENVQVVVTRVIAVIFVLAGLAIAIGLVDTH